MNLKSAIIISIIGTSLFVLSNLIEMYLRFLSGEEFFMLGSFFSNLISTSIIMDFIFSLTLINLFIALFKSQKKGSH